MSKRKKTESKRVVYSKSPLRLTTLGKELEGEMLLIIDQEIIKPLRRQGFSEEGIILTLRSAVKNLPAWLDSEEVIV